MDKPPPPEPQDIFNPSYWSDRLASAIAREQAHYAVFEGSVEKWNEGRRRQEAIIRKVIGPTDSVLDVGCGWGRLLGIMPKEWTGRYLGIDICPDFVELARRAWPAREFCVLDFREPFTEPTGEDRQFDIAVCCSIKPMVVRNAGKGVWDGVEANLRRVAHEILLLGYDDLDDEEGCV